MSHNRHGKQPEPRHSGAVPQAQQVAKAQAAHFAEMKQGWAEQVAADSTLSASCLRVALVFPKWLNRKTLTAWPSQSTIAEHVNATVRTVREALRKLEGRGHIVCLNQYRGGRVTNRYRIVLGGQVFEEPHDESGHTGPARPERPNRGDGTTPTGVSGSDLPVTGDHANRGTPERTLEENKNAPHAPADDSEGHRERRVDPDAVHKIMAQTFGSARMTEHGYLRRDKPQG